MHQGHGSPRGYPRENRVRRRADYVRIQSEGVRVNARHFLLLLSKRADDGPARPGRLGVVASRKIGNAVARNRAKRLVREVFRTTPSLALPGVDLVIIVRPGAHELAFAEVESELRAVAPLVAKRARSLPSSPSSAPGARSAPGAAGSKKEA